MANSRLGTLECGGAVDRPFVYMNMAMTADGKITSARREYPTFTSSYDQRSMDRLRAEADAILVGAGTLRADDPVLGVRDPEMREYRRSLGRPEGLLYVVVTKGGDIEVTSRFFTDTSATGRIVVATEDTSADKLEPLSRLAEVWRSGRNEIDVSALLRRLHERGVERLLVEGGGELNWAFAREDALDEIYVTVAPALLGGREAPTLLEGVGFSMEGRRRLKLLDLHRHEDEIFAHFAVLR